MSGLGQNGLRRVALLGVIVAICACQDYPFTYRPNQRVAATTVREVVVQNSDTDVLFVIDNSGSMLEEQVKLVKNTGLFVGELAASPNIYRIGIVTTNALDEDIPQQNVLGTDGGRLRMRRATLAELSDPNPDFGLGQDLGLALPCSIGTSSSTRPYLERPNDDDADAADQRCRLIKDFMATVASLGIQGSGREAGLDAAWRALDPNGDPDVVSNNTGFLRPDADLAIIFLTDEDDCSYPAAYHASNPPPWPNETCYTQLANAIDVGTFVDSLASLKADSSGVLKIRAALIGGGAFSGEGNADFTPSGCLLTASGPSASCGCWSSSNDPFFCTLLNGYGHTCQDTVGCQTPQNGIFPYCAPTPGASCSADRCAALPSTRYSQFLDVLGSQRSLGGFPSGTFEDSICQPDYDQTLINIARNIVIDPCFPLNADEPVLNPEYVQLIVRHTDPVSGEVTEIAIPRLDPSDPDADCQSCVDCPDGAWQLVTGGGVDSICLECGLTKGTGDDFVLTIINEIIGLDGGAGGE